MKSFLKPVIVICCISFLFTGIKAQNSKPANDTTYYITYPKKLIVTPFLTKDHSKFSLTTPGATKPLNYHTNKPLNLGLRLGYDFLTISGSLGLGNLDPFYNRNMGKTRSLNLQTSFNTQKFVLDLYFENNRGLYLLTNENPGFVIPDNYHRTDIRTSLQGISAKYIINNKRFTAQPPFKFDSRQKKSAGSFLTGVDFFSGSIRGDSALIPKAFENAYPQSDIVKMNYLLFGPNIQYGYTYVFEKKFFATLLGSVNLGISHIKEYTEEIVKTKKWSVQPSANVKAGVGYNTDNSAIIFSYATNRFFFTGENNRTRYFSNNNEYKLSYTKRINPGKTIPKVVNGVGNIIEKIGLGFLIR